ncbi:MAG: hypothetical protein WC534_00900 [Candidatus Paceibacterota bacterium]
MKRIDITIKLILISIGCFLMFIFLFLKNIDFSSYFYSVGSFDFIAFGNIDFSNVKQNEDNNFYIIERSENNKIYSNLFNINKCLYFFSNTDDKNNYYFNNFSNVDSMVALSKNFNDDFLLKIDYDARKRKINFVLPQKNILINQIISTNEIIIYSLNNIDENDVLMIGDKFFDISNLGNSYIQKNYLNNNFIKKINNKSENLIDEKNSDFNVLWQPKVSDCTNKMIGDPQISMELYYNSLKLSSKNHFACTSNSFPINIIKDKIYRFSFDYKNITGNTIKYYYKLIGKDGVVSNSETIKTENKTWNKFSTIIKAEKDYSYLQVFFYAPSDGSTEIINLYDNVKLEQYNAALDVKLYGEYDKNIINVSDFLYLKKGKNLFNDILIKDNLTKDDNFSFESGLWAEKASDCCNKKPGEPDILMELDNDSTEGAKSLKLWSKNHCACTSNSFPILMEDDMLYKFSFDYKSLNGEKIQYYYKLTNKNGESEVKSEIINTKNNNWNKFEKIINPSLKDIISINIFFYAPFVDNKESLVLYDNVRLEEYVSKDIGSYFLYKEQEIEVNQKLKNIEFKPISRFKNKIILHGVRESFLLYYPEKYNENIKIYPYISNKLIDVFNKIVPINYLIPEIELNRQANIDEVNDFIKNGNISTIGTKFISKNFNNSIRNDNLSNFSFFATYFNRPIAENIHYKLNDYGNGWWVDINDLCNKKNLCKENNDGTYDIYMIEEDQFNKILELGLLISGTTLVGCVGYLGYDFIRERKRKKQKGKIEIK